MRLIVMGQQAFGKDVLAKVLDAGTDEVVAVYCEPDRDGKPVDPIKEFALEQGLPVHQPANFDDADTLDMLAGYDADLMVMAFVNVFVPGSGAGHPASGFDLFSPVALAAAPGAERGQLAYYHGVERIRVLVVLPDRRAGRRRQPAAVGV